MQFILICQKNGVKVNNGSLKADLLRTPTCNILIFIILVLMVITMCKCYPSKQLVVMVNQNIMRVIYEILWPSLIEKNCIIIGKICIGKRV